MSYPLKKKFHFLKDLYIRRFISALLLLEKIEKKKKRKFSCYVKVAQLCPTLFDPMYNIAHGIP